MKEETMQRAPVIRQRTGLLLPVFAALAAAITMSLCLACSAFALESRVLTAEFGPDGTAESRFLSQFEGRDECNIENPRFGSLGAIAIDQEDDRLYAGSSCAIAPAAKIYGFDISAAETFTPLAGNFPLDTTGNPGLSDLLVDNSGLASQGHIVGVVLNFINPPTKLLGYDSSGVSLTGFPVEDAPATGFRQGAIDPSGHIWIVDWHDEGTAPTIRKYSPTGAFEGVPIDTSGIGRPFALAFDAAGDAYVGLTGSGKIYEFTAASNYATHTEVAAAGAAEGTAQALAFDPATQDLYVARIHKIEVYDASGGFLYSFGSRSNASYQGVAIDVARDRVFASDGGSQNQQILVFAPFGPVVEFTLGDATGLTGSHASLSGTVDPAGTTITECKFEVGRTKVFGISIPCEGTLPADSSPHPVSATLSGLLPQGTTYYYRLAVKKNGEVFRSETKSFVTPDTLTSAAATGVGNTAATLHGSIDPDGEALTGCFFEYGPTTRYGATVSCEPAAGSIPADAATHALSADLGGLAENSTYHFRAVAATDAGGFAGDDESFTTSGPPIVAEEAATGTDRTSATLVTQVDPRGAATTYHFEWGTDASYGHRLPAEGELSAGSGSIPVEGSFALEGLAENSGYHFRVVATNGRGTTDGPDQSFTTARANASCANSGLRAEESSAALPEGPLGLPECMGFEMVTPPQKFNQDAYKPGLSVNGDRVKFQSDAALAGTPKLGGLLEHYVSSRGPEGWSATPATTPVQYTSGSGVNAVPCSYSPDLSHWSLWASTASQAQLAITTAFRGGLDGSFSALSPTLVPIDSGFGAFSVNEGFCQGSSADSSHEFIEIGRNRPAIYLPGDPRPEGDGSFGAVYEAYRDSAGMPKIELVARDKNGNVFGGKCGAEVGSTGNLLARRGSVSPDASRVYFTTRPGQPAGVPCKGATHGMRVMERLMGPSGAEILEPVSSECTRVSPPCSTQEGDDIFRGASQEGNRFYFTTTRQLVNSDRDNGTDLYLYDGSRPVGSRLSQVSAGDASDSNQGEGAGLLGVADFSGDGSHVYFVATGQLTASLNQDGQQAVLGKPNLYLYERDAAHPDGRTAFIGTLKSPTGVPEEGDQSIWLGPPGRNSASAVPVLGSNFEDESVGGNGHVLVFISRASLLPADHDGGAADVYRYDAETGGLQLVSRAVSDGTGAESVSAKRIEEDTSKVSPNLLSFDRWVSNDGETIAFGTEKGIVPAEGPADSAYVWHDGALHAIAVPSEMVTVSLSGQEVAFVTGSRLLPQDGDGAKDVYVARAGGGFPAPVAASACEGEACQGPPTPPPAGQETVTGSFSGPGNVAPAPAKRCRKGFVRKHGQCVKRRRHGKHKRHTKHHRIGHNARGQGGAK